jgi:predicted ATPase/DNA-binding SARP family transcriptional activator/predicted negative regulator of RcsB-dependent stress response
MPRQPLELCLLGSFTAAVAGHPPAVFPTDKVRALLAYLALEGAPPLRREVLAALFWPEQPETAARQNLRQSLYRLRKLLNKHEENLSSELLIASQKKIGLNKDWLLLDAAVFMEHIAAVGAHDHLSLASCPSCLAQLESAVELYGGDFLSGLFLPDALQFEEWLVTRRERFHREMLQTLSVLADAFEQLGDNKKAYIYARQQIDLEPWREAAHRQLMRLLILEGERGKAIAQYQQVRRILDEELGVSPVAETKALYAKIVSGEEIVSTIAETSPPLLNFPQPAGQLLGREGEIAAIVELLSRPDCRLLTLTGLGGIGKTSLAVAVAPALAQDTRFPDGLTFVSMAGLSTEELMIAGIARALNLTLNNQRGHKEQLIDYLREKKALLVIDNFEHLINSAPLLAELTGAAPGLKILVTSRLPLNIKMEQRLLVSGLDLPSETGSGAGGDARAAAAVRLFEQEARRMQPGFKLSPQNETAVIHICRLVHGIPLAITFAAGWLRLMTAQQIAAEIEQNLDFLASSMRDVPERHRSLRAVFQQSWQMLCDSEKRALAQSAIFCGTFSLDALLTITQAAHSDLANLLDRSFLERVGDNRYTLHELLRQFSTEKLAENPEAAASTAARHARYYLEFVGSNEPLLFGPDSHYALQNLENELGNIDRAWGTAVNQREWSLIEESLDGLVHFSMLSGYYTQIAGMLDQAQARIDGQKNPLLAGYLVAHQANIFIRKGHFKKAAAALEQAQEIALAQNDRRLHARTNMSLGRLFELQGSYDKGLAALQEAHYYYDQARNTVRLARISRLMGNLFWRQSYYAQAAPYYEESLALATQSGDKVFQAVVLGDLGTLYTDSSEFEKALDNLQRARQLDQELGNREGVARHTHNLGRVYRMQENWSQAMIHFKQALQTAEELGLRRGISVCLSNIGIVYWQTGFFEKAIDHYQRALAIDRALGSKEGLSNNTGNLANVYRKMGRFEEADRLINQALEIAQEMGHQEGVARHLKNTADLYKDRRDWEKALDFYDQSVTVYRKFNDPYSLAAALIDKAKASLILDRHLEAAELTREGLALAESVQRHEYIFRGRLQLAQIACAAGDLEKARRQLQELLEHKSKKQELAELYDELWQIDGEECHRQTALDLYRDLSEKTPDVTYKNRLAALSAGADFPPSPTPA